MPSSSHRTLVGLSIYSTYSSGASRCHRQGTAKIMSVYHSLFGFSLLRRHHEVQKEMFIARFSVLSAD